MKNLKVNEELQNKSIDEVLTICGLNWTVCQKPMFLADGIKVDNAFLNLKEDGTQLGIVTERYNPVQNREAFDFIDQLVTNGLVIENAIEQNNGKFVYVIASMGKRYITSLAKEVDCKLVMSTAHNGKGAVKINIVPVLDNGALNLNIKNAKRNISANHSNNIAEKIKKASSIMDVANNYFENLIMTTNVLSKIQYTKIQMERLVSILFDIKDNDISDRKYRNIEARRTEVISMVESNTALGFIMAVSKYIEFGSIERNTETYEDNKFQAVVNGHKLLDKAYEIVSKNL